MSCTHPGPSQPKPGLCLVAGATGYIGSRLVPALLDKGMGVRALGRDGAKLKAQLWSDRVELATADVRDLGSLYSAFEGVETAYYLVHSLDSGPGFEKLERRGAEAFGAAATRCGVRRIVYLGGLLPAVGDEELSAHLRSRAEVGRILRSCGVPTAELRAAVILGSGSASFEMLRYLSERLPAMVTPKWVTNRIQPIAVSDVLHYLVWAADLPSEINRSFDIGGPEILTYRQMMERYAALAGLSRRLIVGVPVLSPSLSSRWVGLVTPVPAAIARPLVESLRHEVICSEHDIARWVPDPQGGLTTFDEAVKLAIDRVGRTGLCVNWPPSPSSPAHPQAGDPEWAGGTVYQDVREAQVDVEARVLWGMVESIAAHGWYFPLAWRLRGWLDSLVGGVGMRRGWRAPAKLRPGEVVDSWRVEHLQAGRLVRLRAEMRLPGLAWLELEVSSEGPNRSRYSQRALFWPRGLAGHVYWWCALPFHHLVFARMAAKLARSAEAAVEACGRPGRAQS